MSDERARNQPGFLSLVLSVFGWAMAGALGWSFFDASELSSGVKVGYFEAWLAALSVGAGAATAVLPLGLAGGWLWHRASIGDRIRERLRAQPAQVGAVSIAATLGCLALSYTSYFSLAVYRALFASGAVHQLALSLSLPVCALLIWLLARIAVAPLRRSLERIQSADVTLQTAAAINLCIVVAWGFSLTRLGAEIWKNISALSLMLVAAVGLMCLIGALLASWKPARYVAGALLVLPVPWLVMYGVGEPNQALRLAMVYGNSGTGAVMTRINTQTHHGFATAEANRGKSAVCFPDMEPPHLRDVGRAAEDAPDIIWLTIDAIRWDHTTLSGYERDTTPNIAAHAPQAAVFEQAYTPATSTRQTMRSLFTGTHASMIDPPRGPMWGLTLPPEQNTLAQYLSMAGYHTTALSSENNIFSSKDGGLQGFNVIDETPSQQKIALGYSAPHSIDRIIEELDQVDGPQFLWSHLIEPHQPYRVGPDPIDFGPEEMDRYDAALHFVDREVGRLLEFVAKRQASHPTYVVLTADHGHAFREHGNRYHGTTTFQEETHVPLIVWGPDIVPARYDTPVAVLDIFATTLELAGLRVPRASCSMSLAAVLRSDETPTPRPVYIEQVPDYSRAYFSVAFILGTDKIIVEPMAHAVSLFDLAADPGELLDLAEAEPERLRRHVDALLEYWRERGMDPADYGLGGGL